MAVTPIIASSNYGTCQSYNIVYCFICNICTKGYVGRTVQRLCDRVGPHRRNFYSILRNTNDALLNDEYRQDDEYSLGIHLDKHGLNGHSDFEKTYSLIILKTCSPKNLEICDYRFIQTLNTLTPHGLNLPKLLAYHLYKLSLSHTYSLVYFVSLYIYLYVKLY